MTIDCPCGNGKIRSLSYIMPTISNGSKTYTPHTVYSQGPDSGLLAKGPQTPTEAESWLVFLDSAFMEHGWLPGLLILPCPTHTPQPEPPPSTLYTPRLRHQPGAAGIILKQLCFSETSHLEDKESSESWLEVISPILFLLTIHPKKQLCEYLT